MKRWPFRLAVLPAEAPPAQRHLGDDNDGHDYGDTEFDRDQRKALVEYLKSL